MRSSALVSLSCLSAAMAVLSACASTPSPENTYSARAAKLESDCKARGGILVSSGQLTNRPETDNVCNIIDGSTHVSRQ